MRFSSFLKTCSTAFFLLSVFCISVSAYGQEEVSLREKIARMLMVSVYGTDPALNSDMRACIEDLKVGGIIIFEKWGKNTINIESREQLSTMLRNIKETADYPIFIGVDQEGGLVSRLKEKYGYPPSVSPQQIGSVNNYWYTFLQADTMAHSLKSSGFNMNFFPSLDININPSSPAIGRLRRSFSADPNAVYRMAEIFYDIQKDSGIVSVFKHFPGHGSAKADSHLNFTDVSQTWQETELEIYERFIHAGKCDAIMCSHIYNKQLDSLYPASISRKILTKLMRDQIGYQGLFISDDIGMKALSERWSTREILKLSINAGIDMLMILRGNAAYYAQIITMIEEMVYNKEIPLYRIEESYQRIKDLQDSL